MGEPRKPRKLCLTCGKENPRPQHIFCSVQCRAASTQKPRNLCLICNSVCPRRQTYCSNKCANIAKRSPVRPCAICGNDLTCKQLFYCSPECRGKGRRDKYYDCKQCGEKFYSKEQTAIYCSRACSAAYIRSLKDELRKRIQVFWDQGIRSHVAIAEKLGVSKDTIRHQRHKMGLRHDPRPPGRIQTAYAKRKPEQLPEPFRNIVKERLIFGDAPLPPMHSISWGAIAL